MWLFTALKADVPSGCSRFAYTVITRTFGPFRRTQSVLESSVLWCRLVKNLYYWFSHADILCGRPNPRSEVWSHHSMLLTDDKSRAGEGYLARNSDNYHSDYYEWYEIQARTLRELIHPLLVPQILDPGCHTPAVIGYPHPPTRFLPPPPLSTLTRWPRASAGRATNSRSCSPDPESVRPAMRRFRKHNQQRLL